MATAARTLPLFRASATRVAARTAFRSNGASRQAMRRGFATEVPPSAPQGKSNTPLILGLVGAAAAGGAYYYFGATSTPSEAVKEIGTKADSARAVAENKLGLKRSKDEYQKVYNRIAETLEKDDYDDGSLIPVIVRLAWHSSGTYDKETNTGGSNYATMRFKPESEHGANNGLNVARDHMEKIKQEFPWISYGDLWTLGGVCAVQEAQGPKIPWRPGRIDGFEKDVTPDGRLPDASQAQDHLRNIFYRMGFNDQEIVALSGAHCLGRCHTDRSGFDGPWTFSPTTFTNDYFKLLFDEKWNWRKWSGPAQFQDTKTKSLMMLPTDMALVKDKTFKKYAKAYADDTDLFFKDFAAAFSKLLELGIPKAQLPEEQWIMTPTEEQ